MSEKHSPDHTETLLQQAEALIATARAKCEETDRLLSDLGLDRGCAQRFLQGSKAPTAEREKAADELAALKLEIENELAQAVAEQMPPPAPTSRTTPISMRSRAMRV